MTHHFTPLGNHLPREAVQNDTAAISTNIDAQFKKGSRYKRGTKESPKESPLQHIKRIAGYNINAVKNSLSLETLERAKLFMAIREQVMVCKRKPV